MPRYRYFVFAGAKIVDVRDEDVVDEAAAIAKAAPILENPYFSAIEVWYRTRLVRRVTRDEPRPSPS
jgi:hypothetical protein